jgi:two-component system response regulator YesN
MYSVLVVDDEYLMRRYLTDHLPEIDPRWQVTGEAADGMEAVELLNKNAYDLVITDIRMSEMNGLELIRYISRMRPAIKVVILSGYDEFSYAQEAVRFGVSDYILKPVNDGDLRDVLERIAGRLQSQNVSDLTLKILQNMPSDATMEITRSFLFALIYNRQSDIKTLYPLVHRLKISLIEGVSAALIVSPDIPEILIQRRSVSEIPVYRLILQRVVSEATENVPWAKACANRSDDAVLLVTGEDSREVSDRCRQLYETVNAAMQAQSEIPVCAAFGEAVDDILQFGTAYRSAYAALSLLLAVPPPAVCRYISEKQFAARIQELTGAIYADLERGDLGKLYADVASYCNALSPAASPETLLRYGAFMLRHPSEASGPWSDRIDFAYKSLLDLLDKSRDMELSEKEGIGALYEMTASLADIPKTKPLSGRECTILVEKAKEYICTHFREPLSLAMISGDLGVSASYLSDVFHKDTGESYSRFLTRIRMEQAAVLIRANPNEKIYSIAEQVGFVSAKHFNSVFKKYFGVTPGDYAPPK